MSGRLQKDHRPIAMGLCKTIDPFKKGDLQLKTGALSPNLAEWKRETWKEAAKMTAREWTASA
jgi:hypothetical protein